MKRYFFSTLIGIVAGLGLWLITRTVGST